MTSITLEKRLATSLSFGSQMESVSLVSLTRTPLTSTMTSSTGLYDPSALIPHEEETSITDKSQGSCQPTYALMSTTNSYQHGKALDT